jgi:hypothetical protein
MSYGVMIEIAGGYCTFPARGIGTREMARARMKEIALYDLNEMGEPESEMEIDPNNPNHLYMPGQIVSVVEEDDDLRQLYRERGLTPIG